ncbi:MAG: hypothetical protein ACR2GB_00100 [Nocardioidaceae bacterium]
MHQHHTRSFNPAGQLDMTARFGFNPAGHLDMTAHFGSSVPMYALLG